MSETIGIVKVTSAGSSPAFIIPSEVVSKLKIRKGEKFYIKIDCEERKMVFEPVR